MVLPLEEFEEIIVDCATQRGILPNVYIIAQFNKTMEDTQELSQGISSQNKA